jgi:hypothetical protein
MNARKKKGMGGPKGILGQRRRPYPQISVTPTFCIFTGIDDFIHYSPPPHQSTEIVARHLDLKIYFDLTIFQ